ncbi:MAG: hypothetical protein M9953_15005, partial [Thermomicrobiales bacterium]|nr:hypothetical protein [Thermomicrobiales bacterium]
NMAPMSFTFTVVIGPDGTASIVLNFDVVTPTATIPVTETPVTETPTGTTPAATEDPAQETPTSATVNLPSAGSGAYTSSMWLGSATVLVLLTMLVGAFVARINHRRQS